ARRERGGGAEHTLEGVERAREADRGDLLLQRSAAVEAGHHRAREAGEEGGAGRGAEGRGVADADRRTEGGAEAGVAAEHAEACGERRARARGGLGRRGRVGGRRLDPARDVRGDGPRRTCGLAQLEEARVEELDGADGEGA